jgi:endoglucanase
MLVVSIRRLQEDYRVAEIPRVVDRFGQLSVAHGRIEGERNGVAQLRGVSLFWSQWMPQFYNASAIRWLRDDWHVDVVRAAMGVHRGGYLEHPRRELRKLRTVIEAAIDCGIYVIVDWHAHLQARAAAGDFFARIARDYAEYPNIIYETWNEPDGRYEWAKNIKPYHESVIASIREHDSRNLIVVGTPHWSHRVDIAAADPIALDNVAYSLHFYAGSNAQALRAVAATAIRHRIALLVTEWGTCRADASGRVFEEESRRWLDFLESERLGYVNWSICDKDEIASALLPGASPRGGWSEKQLSASGSLVRDQLRSMSMRTR